MKIIPFAHIFHTFLYPQFTRKHPFHTFYEMGRINPPFCVYTLYTTLPSQTALSEFPHANSDELATPLFSQAAPREILQMRYSIHQLAFNIFCTCVGDAVALGLFQLKSGETSIEM